MGELRTMAASYLESARARRTEIRENLAAARQQLGELRSLPLSAEETRDRLLAVIDAEAAAYTAEIHRMINGASSLSAFAVEVRMTWCAGLLATVCRDQLRDLLLEMIKKTDIKRGPPYAERVKEITVIEQRIKDLDGRDAAIVKELEILREEIEG